MDNSDSESDSEEEEDRERQIQFTPTVVPRLATTRFSSLVAGHDHLLGLTLDGRVFTWGNGQKAQLGRKLIERRRKHGLTPERMGLKDVVKIATGDYHAFAIDKKGVVYGWGLNNYGQVGVGWEDFGMDEEELINKRKRSAKANGGILQQETGIVFNPTIVETLLPSKLGNGRKVVDIAAGEHHSLFLVGLSFSIMRSSDIHTVE